MPEKECKVELCKSDYGDMINYAADIISQKIVYGLRKEYNDADPVPRKSYSAQIAKAEHGPSFIGFPLVTVSVPMIVVPYDNYLKIDRFYWEVFSQQAKQDVIVQVKVGSRVIFRSGKINPLNRDSEFYVQEVRLINFNGAPLMTHTYPNVLIPPGPGVPELQYVDHFAADIHEDATARETEVVAFELINQSRVFHHWIRVHIIGTVYPNTYQTGKGPKMGSPAENLKKKGFIAQCPME
jgi:hypothetical protein